MVIPDSAQRRNFAVAEDFNLLRVFELHSQESSRGLLSGEFVENFFCFGVSCCPKVPRLQ